MITAVGDILSSDDALRCDHCGDLIEPWLYYRLDGSSFERAELQRGPDGLFWCIECLWSEA